MNIKIDKVIALCKQIVTCLKEENYDTLRADHALSRVSVEDIKRVVEEYGGHISTLPHEAFHTDTFHIYPYNDHSGLKVDLDLWVDGKRSDLTLQVEFTTDYNGSIEHYRILDLLVM